MSTVSIYWVKGGQQRSAIELVLSWVVTKYEKVNFVVGNDRIWMKLEDECWQKMKELTAHQLVTETGWPDNDEWKNKCFHTTVISY